MNRRWYFGHHECLLYRLTQLPPPDKRVNLKNRPRSKRKGKGDKQKLGVASSRGFGGSNVRPTKGVPDRLVVADVSADEAGDSDIEQDEDSVVDWSEGQQLVEVIR